MSNSSTSRYESENRRYQRTAQTMISGSKCRHLNSAGRVLIMEHTAAYQTRSLSFCNTAVWSNEFKSRRPTGKVAKGLVKPSTVHQEYRVLRRMLNVAVRKKLLVANPCSGVEFPVRVKGLFRPHYMTWSEQEKIEARRAGLPAQRDPYHHGNGPAGI